MAAIVLAQAPNGLVGLFRLPDFAALADASAWRRRQPAAAERRRRRLARRPLMLRCSRSPGLRSGYGRTEVLHGVDLACPPGAAVALLGANGAGKTTLLKTIAGLVPARDRAASASGASRSSGARPTPGPGRGSA